MSFVRRFGRDSAGQTMRWAMRAVALLGVLVIQVGCETSGRQPWEKGLGHCGPFSPNGLGYLGPTENVGPGAVWRTRPQNGGFGLTRSADRAPLPEHVVREEEWVVGPEDGTPVRWSSASGVVLAQIGGVTGDLASTFDRAKQVSFTVDAWRELRLDEGAFVEWVGGLPDDHEYRRALLRNERVVAWRAVQARGLVADLSFEASDAEQLRTTLASGTSTMSGIAGLGTRLDLEWIAPAVLRVSSREDFVVFTGLAVYAPSRAASERGVLVPVPIKPDAPMVYEMLDGGAGAAY